jgi:hypothetical protein
VFEKYSYGSLEISARVKPGETGFVTFENGRRVGFEALPTGKAALVPALAKIRLSEGRVAGKREVVFVYCSESVPTVSWPDKLIELSVVNEPGRYERATVTASNAVYKLACGKRLPTIQKPSAVAATAPNSALGSPDAFFKRTRNVSWYVEGLGDACYAMTYSPGFRFALKFPKEWAGRGYYFELNNPPFQPSSDNVRFRIIGPKFGERSGSWVVDRENGKVILHSPGADFMGYWRTGHTLFVELRAGQAIVVDLLGASAAGRDLDNCVDRMMER